MHDIASEILSMREDVENGKADPLELATDIYILDKALKAAKAGLEAHVIKALGEAKTAEKYGFKITKRNGSRIAVFDEVPYVAEAARYLNTAKELAKKVLEEQALAKQEGREPLPISHPDFGEVTIGASIKVGAPSYSIKPSK